MSKSQRIVDVFECQSGRFCELLPPIALSVAVTCANFFHCSIHSDAWSVVALTLDEDPRLVSILFTFLALTPEN